MNDDYSTPTTPLAGRYNNNNNIQEQPPMHLPQQRCVHGALLLSCDYPACSHHAAPPPRTAPRVNSTVNRTTQNNATRISINNTSRNNNNDDDDATSPQQQHQLHDMHRHDMHSRDVVLSNNSAAAAVATTTGGPSRRQRSVEQPQNQQSNPTSNPMQNPHADMRSPLNSTFLNSTNTNTFDSKPNTLPSTRASSSWFQHPFAPLLQSPTAVSSDSAPLPAGASDELEHLQSGPAPANTAAAAATFGHPQAPLLDIHPQDPIVVVSADSAQAHTAASDGNVQEEQQQQPPFTQQQQPPFTQQQPQQRAAVFDFAWFRKPHLTDQEKQIIDEQLANDVECRKMCRSEGLFAVRPHLAANEHDLNVELKAELRADVPVVCRPCNSATQWKHIDGSKLLGCQGRESKRQGKKKINNNSNDNNDAADPVPDPVVRVNCRSGKIHVLHPFVAHAHFPTTESKIKATQLLRQRHDKQFYKQMSFKLI